VRITGHHLRLEQRLPRVAQDRVGHEDVEARAAAGRGADLQVPAAPLEHPAHQGQPDAAPAERGWRLGRVARLEDLLAQRGRDPGPRVGDAHPQRAVAVRGEPELHPRCRSVLGPGSVHGIVDQVAEHGQEGGCVRELAVELQVRREAELDAALVGDGGLREQQRRGARVVDALTEELPEPGIGRRDLRDELDRVVVVAQLEQAGDRVHAVGELVRLRP
jgi:hypothetical protein